MEPQNTNPLNSTPAPPSPAPEPFQNINSPQVAKNSFGLGILSFITGTSMAVVTACVYFLPIMDNVFEKGYSSLYVFYGFMTALSLVSLLVFSIRSFKKIPYPNILGLIGLVLNLFVLYTSASALISYAALSSNVGGY